jgi:glycosyltransferase involved in cell wall biosynthesis
MDIFVQPSLSEAFSQVLIEAMGVGLPVIATDVGGAREVVESGENGFLVKANSSHEIFQNTMMLLENLELRETIGAAARTAVNEQFTIAAMVDGQYKLYKDWLSKRKRKQEK